MVESGYRKDQNFLGFFSNKGKYGFLSNFYEKPFFGTENNVSIRFDSAEQAVHFRKALLFNDIECGTRILNAKDPKEAKALGRQVRNFDSCKWDTHKRAIYYKTLMEKFKYDSDLRDKLLETKAYVLVECSPYDRIWGIGYDKTSPEFIGKHFDKWGQNLLGLILMEVRRDIELEDTIA